MSNNKRFVLDAKLAKEVTDIVEEQLFQLLVGQATKAHLAHEVFGDDEPCTLTQLAQAKTFARFVTQVQILFFARLDLQRAKRFRRAIREGVLAGRLGAVEALERVSPDVDIEAILSAVRGKR